MVQVKVQLCYRMLRCEWKSWACKIVDISLRGLGVVLSAALRKGETLSIADPRTKAIVVWI